MALSSSHWGVFECDVEDGRLAGVRPYAKDSAPSPMIYSVPGAVHAKSRVTRPMVRKGYLDNGPAAGTGRRGADPFVPVSWERALDLVADEIERVRVEHGNQAIFAGSYGWASAGRFHNGKTHLHRLLNMLGGFTDQVTSYSFGAAMVLFPHVFGSPAMAMRTPHSWPVVAHHTELMVMFGGAPLKNAQADYGGCGDHTAEAGLRAAKDNGASFINIGPVRADAAAFLDAEWWPIVPNTDTALMLGLAHTLYSEGLHDPAFLARYTVGFERFIPYLTGAADGIAKSAEWAAAITGIEAERIRDLAQRMAKHRTLLNLSWSIQRGDHGEQPYWMAVMLASMLGQMHMPGGGVGFGYGAANHVGNHVTKLPLPGIGTGENPTGAYIPVARITDMLLSPGETIDFDGKRVTYPDVRMVYWCGGNPFHHHQDINRMLRAWDRPETIVVHEPWWTPLARHADIVLPATTSVERNDIGANNNDRFIIAMKQAVAPLGEARDDYRIFADLAAKFGKEAAFTEGRDEMAWLRHLYDLSRQQVARVGVTLPDFDVFWADGEIEIPVPDEIPRLLGAFWDDPAANPLKTPSGKIELYSETIAGFGYDDCPGHPAWLEPEEWLGNADARGYPLHLISNQPETRLHSQLDMAGVSQDSKINGREPAWIHPGDAAARGIEDGDVVRIYNGRGACLAGAVVSEDVMPGVVRVATGAWYDPLAPGVPGSLDRHGNPNMLTLDKPTSKLAQAPAALTALVEVERYADVPPPITVFDPPSTQPCGAALVVKGR